MAARGTETTPFPTILLLATAAFFTLAGSMTADDAPTPPGIGIADPDFLDQYAATYRFTLGKPAAITPTPNGDAVYFLRSPPRSFVRDLYRFDPATGEEHRVLTAADLLGAGEERISAVEKARRERQRLVARGIARFDLSADGRRILVPLAGRLYVVERASGAIRTLDVEGDPIDPRLDPAGTRIACVIDGDLHVIDIATGTSTRLTRRSADTVSHGLAEFVAQEEMDRDHGYWWSPDGRFLAYQQTDTAGMERLSIADPMNPAAAPSSAPYPRPGEANAAVRLGVIPAAGGDTVWIEWDRARYPYLATVAWQLGAPLTVLVQNRHQTEEVLYAADHRDGSLRQLLVERDQAWLELDQEMPRWLPDGSGFLWSTERNGNRQLELRGASGALRQALTEPALTYRGLIHLDAGHAVVRASVDPTGQQVLRLPAGADTGGGSQPWQDRPGINDAEVARDGSLRVMISEPADGPWQATVHDAAGRRLGALRSLAESPSFTPTTVLTTAGEDPAFHAAVTLPRNLDRALRYPVIVQVYGGPTSQMVRRSRDRYRFAQWIADHGFAVVSIDGRGTPNRGRAWSRAVKGDLIGQPLEDQVTALRALGARMPELDLERAGIYGWSFGGYFAAMAAMRRGDVFHAAVAGAPVTDWQDYDTHYTERYLGLPQEDPESYRRSSVLTYAAQLERPLLIVHGTADDNVYFVHALKMSDALFRAGRQHDFLALAGFTHMVPDPLVTRRLYGRIMRFFAEHLGTPRPR